MDKFIKLLLENENTAILPGFGAIVIENENTGKLMFNEYLKFNDGKLDTIIVENSNMDTQEAQNYVSKYVREIMQMIDKGETYDIFELGSFSKDNDGKIIFDGSLSLSTTTPAEAATEDKVEEVTEEATIIEKEIEEPTPLTSETERPIEEKTLPKEDAPKPVEEQTSSDIKEEQPEKTKQPTESPKEAEQKARLAEKEKKEAAKTAKKKEDEALKVAKEKAKKDQKQDKKPKEGKKKKKKGFLFWILIMVLILFGAGSVYIALNYDGVKSHMGWDEFEEVKNLALEIEEDDEVRLEEGLAQSEKEYEKGEEEEPLEQVTKEAKVNDALEESSKDKEQEKQAQPIPAVQSPKPEKKPTKEQQKSASGSGSYHLIAGTFSNRENAEKLVSDLKAKGHPAEIIGVLNGLTYVSAQAFTSSTEARDNVERVQNDAPGAWIYKQP